MSNEIETLKSEFEALRSAFTSKINDQLPKLTTSEDAQQRRLLVNQAVRDLEEADEIIAELEIKAKTLPTNQKLKATALVRNCRAIVKNARKDLQKAGSIMADRAQLFAGASTAVDVNDGMDQRGRLLQGTERLQNGTERLQNIQRIANESETIGAGTLSDLGRQREQIVRTRDRLEGADSWISQSTSVLRGMQWQITKGTIIQNGAIVALIILIVIAIYVKYF